MSESSNNNGNHKAKSPKQTGQSDYMEIRHLIEEINNGETSSGYNPLPCEQHLWLMDPENPPMDRLWGWMIQNTVALGHRTAYASSKRIYDEEKRAWIPGHALTIKHVAKALGGDESNWYRTWRNAVRRGWARNGTETEGKERLYLTGKVPKKKERETIGAHPQKGDWPAHIWKYYEQWPEEKRAKFDQWAKSWEKEAAAASAAAVQATRDTYDDMWDTGLQEFGVPPNRQEHVKVCPNCKAKAHQPGCPIAMAAEIRGKVLATLRPALQNSVQTVREFVQLQKSDTVQPEKPPVSLLPFQSSSEKGNRSVGTLAVSRNRNASPMKGERPKNQLPALVKPPALSPNEKATMQTIYAEVGRMQSKFRHMAFAQEKISETRESDQMFAYSVLSMVGSEMVPQFLLHVEQNLEKLNRNALGKKPGSAPGPRSLGLLWDWAVKWSQHVDESARVGEEEKQRWISRAFAACREIVSDRSETADAKLWAQKFLESPEMQAQAWDREQKRQSEAESLNL